ncbi:uncharacterized protein CPUR_07157 [Claviceps purpurea 20.1]|uniref:Uncharacterized protein n=1 Tax=Claviceps purpurea (strain 20.1) TaxID=1111077 RepID=M1WF00_CLAP2|nr:uncharacterized protein CPUR_07157 [Claviceps purpurea 20.1]
MHSLPPRQLDRDKGPDNPLILSSQYGHPNHQDVPGRTGSLSISYDNSPTHSATAPLRRTPSHPRGLVDQPGPSDHMALPRQTGFPGARCPQPNAFDSRSLSRTLVDQLSPSNGLSGMDCEGWDLPVQYDSNFRECDARYLYGGRYQYGPDPLAYPGYGYQTYGLLPCGHYSYGPPPYSYHDNGRPTDSIPTEQFLTTTKDSPISRGRSGRKESG